ncbi:hypothetical protein QBC41DRAFT_328356 [Cercophora samala]|uniref:F-box domain-containing protein n=1 Tax=Cercophora samala TaxID=330535 RepID=A0AA40D682_9PEZI|nr:hypothetical protein QBC41DRAFT_328356 [Cercophora samala]
MTAEPDQAGHNAAVPKGKEIEITAEASSLERLPPELVYSILSYLEPLDLVAVSATSRTLYTRATADHLWQALIQENIPGVQVRTPSPCKSFKALYEAHDPHWFLPKHKIWFSDDDLTGRLIIVRYDPRRGCIEGYQVVARAQSRTFEPWAADRRVMIHNFDPVVRLHLDKPILQLDPYDPDNTRDFGRDSPSHSGIKTVKLNRDRSRSSSPNRDAGPSRSRSRSKSNTPKRSRISSERLMQNSTDSMYSALIHSRILSETEISSRIDEPFPYGGLWPPPTIPSSQRVIATSFDGLPGQRLSPLSRPSSRSDLSDTAFRIKKWIALRVPGDVGVDNIRDFFAGSTSLTVDPDVDERLPLRMHIGEDIHTYATLDPKLYTPTKEKPFRGIWVGDYSGHGCEFLLVTQPDDETPFDPEAIQPRQGETPDEFEKRRYEETIYRGRLDAVKLTGDPNVPRGELTFRVDDLGDGGLVKVCRHEPFEGVRIVRSEGHIASTGFVMDSFIESELLLISPDRLAQHWIEWGHVSFFVRVDIDQFLGPA